MADAYDLQRFLTAQQGVYGDVTGELASGRKRSHWMWFIFPQVRGLGMSARAEKFAIASADEARAYLDHPILGVRLRECTQLVLDIDGRTIEQIFGYPDYLKFRSCMTLFAASAADPRDFTEALTKYFDGAADDLTLQKLEP